MRLKKLTALCFGGVLALGVGQAALADGFRTITTEAEYRKIFIGKTMTYSDTTQIKVRGNNTLTGKLRGEKYKAAWAWRDRYFCSTRLTHDKTTDCFVIEVNGNQVRTTGGRGKATSYVASFR